MIIDEIYTYLPHALIALAGAGLISILLHVFSARRIGTGYLIGQVTISKGFISHERIVIRRFPNANPEPIIEFKSVHRLWPSLVSAHLTREEALRLADMLRDASHSETDSR